MARFRRKGGSVTMEKKDLWAGGTEGLGKGCRRLLMLCSLSPPGHPHPQPTPGPPSSGPECTLPGKVPTTC